DPAPSRSDNGLSAEGPDNDPASSAWAAQRLSWIRLYPDRSRCSLRSIPRAETNGTFSARWQKGLQYRARKQAVGRKDSRLLTRAVLSFRHPSAIYLFEAPDAPVTLAPPGW